MIQQNYFQICIQQNFRSFSKIVPCNKKVIPFNTNEYNNIVKE